jgi:hypothetical protein
MSAFDPKRTSDELVEFDLAQRPLHSAKAGWRLQWEVAMAASHPPSRSAPIHLGAFGAATSAALVVLFVLCWLVAAIMPGLEGASHGWIILFTKAPVGSVRALMEGVIWSIIFGWIIAIVMVPIYNRIAGDR